MLSLCLRYSSSQFSVHIIQFALQIQLLKDENSQLKAQMLSSVNLARLGQGNSSNKTKSKNEGISQSADRIDSKHQSQFPFTTAVDPSVTKLLKTEEEHEKVTNETDLDLKLVATASTNSSGCDDNGLQKRKRRMAHQILRLYKCPLEKCHKSYG